MKPNWDDAPKWAQWLAMDADGEWWWFDVEPVLLGREWQPASGSNVQKVRAPYWQESLERRPEEL